MFYRFNEKQDVVIESTRTEDNIYVDKSIVANSGFVIKDTYLDDDGTAIVLKEGTEHFSHTDGAVTGSTKIEVETKLITNNAAHYVILHNGEVHGFDSEEAAKAYFDSL